MPLIKRPPGQSAATSATPASGASAQLQSSDADLRWKAARAIGADASAVPAIATALQTESSTQVREALFTSLVTIGTPDAARAAARFVRSEDAAVRSGALDALEAMPEAVAPLLPELLRDADRDVRILSCELVRNLDATTAARLLSPLLESDAETSVCGAAIDVLAEIGSAGAVPALKACKARFPDEAFLGFAIDDAIDRAGAGRLDGDE